MVHIIFLILKILGIILLVLLGLVLLILALILFVPIRYRAEGKRYEIFQGKARVTWLFRIFAIHAEFDEELKISVRIFGVPLKKKQADQQNREGDGPEPEQEQMENKKDQGDVPEPDVHIASVEDTSEDFSYGGADRTGEESLAEKTCRQRKSGGRIRSFFQNLKAKAAGVFHRIQKIAKRLWNIWRTIEDKAGKIRQIVCDKENQDLFFLILKQLKSLLTHIFPRRIRGKIYIGFEDPYTTGQAMAIAGLLCPVYKDSLEVIPSFDEPVLKGELRCSGRIRLFTLLVIGGKLAFNKRFRRLIKKLLDLR